MRAKITPAYGQYRILSEMDQFSYVSATPVIHNLIYDVYIELPTH